MNFQKKYKKILTVMKEYRDCIKLLVIISCCIPYILGAPNEDEQQKKNSKKMPLVMQTLLADIAGELLSRSTSNSQVNIYLLSFIVNCT